MSPRGAGAAFFAKAALAGAEGRRAGLLRRFLRRLPAGCGPGGQSADVSFTSSDPGAVRFSVNDSLRRGGLPAAVRAAALEAGAAYDLGALARFAALGRALRGGCQTTAAVEWASGAAAPVFKLYLEEAPGLAAAWRSAAFRRALRALAGRPLPPASAGAPDILALDLPPGGGTDLKLYFRRPELPAGLAPAQRRAMRALGREPHRFYYEMRRLGSGGSKVYKVYETAVTGAGAAGVAEICALYASLGVPEGVRFASSRLRLARRAGLRLLPTLCGAGLSGGRLKIDAYFRFSPV